MMVNLIKLSQKIPNLLKYILKSIFIVLPVFFSAYLSNYISGLISNSIPNWGINLLILFIFVTCLVVFSKLFNDAKRKLEDERILRKDTIVYVYSLIQSHFSRQQKLLSDMNGHNDLLNIDNFIKICIDSINDLIQNFYQTLESKYGKNDQIENRINFEVTFMTRSYIDNEITIPASANRDGRAPLSMQKRKDNVKIYDNTVTATLYRTTRPVMQIIPNTDDENKNIYYECYAGQKKRIKSTIIFPVLCPKNLLLGTIVTHCDKENFFRDTDEKFWREIFEIFSKAIGLEKIRLDNVKKNHNKAPF